MSIKEDPAPGYLDMELLRFTTAGSVDDGKSTLIGRLLYDSKSIFEDQMEAIERATYSLILEGASEGLWAFKDAKMQSRLLAKYYKEKSAVVTADFDERGRLIAVNDPANPRYTKVQKKKRKTGPRRR